LPPNTPETWRALRLRHTDEAVGSHEIFAAALRSHAEKRAIEL